MSELSLSLKGLNCPNCAGKIEKSVNRMEGIEEATLNLMNQEIIITYDGIEKNDLISRIRKITTDLEPHVIVEEKTKRRRVKAAMGTSAVNISQKNTHVHSHEHGENCNCGHDIDHEEVSESRRLPKTLAKQALTFQMKLRLLRYAVGLGFFVPAVLNIIPDFTFWFFIISYALFGADVILKALKNILHGEVFDENFLMSISTVGAFVIGEYPEAVAVMIFYQIGEFFQDMAVDRSRDSIKSLMDLKADYANLVTDEGTVRVDPSDVSIGDIILIKPGEKIPLDGIISEGRTQIDQSSLVGESIPKTAEEGEKVLSGALNLSGAIKVRVTTDYENSTVAKILDMVENASNKKAPTEKFITRFSKIYTPAVVLAAALLAFIPPILIPGAEFSDWLYRGLVFLVVSCPCALVISVPLSYFSGIGFASKKGILVKGSAYMEALDKVDTVVFDKTGTLTKGVFTVTAFHPQESAEKNELLSMTYALEEYSNHPIAKSIVKEYNKSGLSDSFEIKDFEEISGEGLKGILNGKTLLTGNKRLMENNGIKPAEYNGFGTVIHTSYDGKYLGFIEISDIVKEDSQMAISRLKKLGIKRIAMLSGDKKEVAEKIAFSLGIDKVFSELLPHEKVNAIEDIYSNETSPVIAFAGDGINDAPVLARVDVGIAMGGVGSDAAIEAADIVIMTDEPSKICDAIETARNTMKIVKQNIAFALVIKFGVLFLSVFGFASMWLAVFADVGVALIAVLNAMRAK